MTIGEYWEKYLKESNQNADEVGFSGEISFEVEKNPIVGTERLALVLGGKKTVMFSAYDSYGINMENLPVSGEMYIVEDSTNEPRAIIEIVSVNVIPFCDISWELASRDGEDSSFDEWREKTLDLMEDEAALCGFDFKPDSKVVCEIFRVVYR